MSLLTRSSSRSLHSLARPMLTSRVLDKHECSLSCPCHSTPSTFMRHFSGANTPKKTVPQIRPTKIVKKKTKGVVSDSKYLGDTGLLESLLEKQLSENKFEDKRSPEELALDSAFSKEYSRRMMVLNRQQQVAEGRILRSRWEAINALPSALRELAKAEDQTHWPRYWMPIPWTTSQYLERFAETTVVNIEKGKSKKK